jgi:4-cresol dehydrogenase (hydroxylating)
VADKLLRTADGAFPSARTWHIAKYGAGAWCVSGAFYGTSDDAVLPLVERMKAHLGQSGKARDVSHEEASANPVLQIQIDTFSGRPTRAELGLVIWRPGGGICWVLPSLPMIGTIANRHQARDRSSS